MQEIFFDKTEVKTIFVLTCLIMIMGWFFQIYVSNQKFKNSMDLFLLVDDDKSHYVCITDFNRFMFHKTKN